MPDRFLSREEMKDHTTEFLSDVAAPYVSDYMAKHQGAEKEDATKAFWEMMMGPWPCCFLLPGKTLTGQWGRYRGSCRYHTGLVAVGRGGVDDSIIGKLLI